MHKKCSKCKKTKEDKFFYKRSGSKSLHSACKDCEKNMAKKWYQKNPGYAKSKAKKWREEHPEKVAIYREGNRLKSYMGEVKRKYGLSENGFKEMLQSQNEKCLICESHFAWNKRSNTPHVDHCHASGKVRGLLCRRCNSSLGYFNDNPALFESAANYLKCHG